MLNKKPESFYPSQESAMNRAKQLEQEWLANPSFCPLINGDCNNRCVCFYNAGISEASRYLKGTAGKTAWWRAYEPSCDNAMFFEKEFYHA